MENGYFKRGLWPLHTSVFWLFLLMVCASLYFIDVFQIQYYSQQLLNPSPTPMNQMPSKENLHNQKLRGFLINTPGCRIPDMKPFDPSVNKFYEKPTPAICNKGKPALFESTITSINIINSSLVSYGIEDQTELKCCYRSFVRREPKDDERDNMVIYNNECVNFTDSTDINDEFIEVLCDYNGNTIYKDYFAFVPYKNTSDVNKTDQKNINVLIVGLDAVSRVNLHRQMPKTAGYLLDIGSVELLGYNKVADNTFPNLIPVLTGMYEAELKNSCWTHTNDRFDECPFLWREFKTRGYTTAFGEDSSWMGMFNYQRYGFKKQPVDYMYGYFNQKSESVVGNSHNMNVEECEGAREVYKDFLNYVKTFVVRMDQGSLPYFGFFWGSSLSHDYLNKPQLGDDFYFDFFKSLKDDGHLENTVLFFISDHGIRWGEIRQTYQGRMEERLPFIIATLPEWVKLQYPEAYKNLEKNTMKLTTPFDMHETLKDLLDLNGLTFENLTLRNTNASRGYSLFSNIPNNRSCKDAEIDSHWCTCQQSKDISTNSTEVMHATKFAVKNMNEQLEGYAQCANLTLDAVLDARLMSHGEHILNGDTKTKDYMITLRTLPGEGVFEVTVRENRGTYDVIGTISRLNLYGQQSSCITDFHLKLYCYCTNLLL